MLRRGAQSTEDTEIIPYALYPRGVLVRQIKRVLRYLCPLVDSSRSRKRKRSRTRRKGRRTRQCPGGNEQIETSIVRVAVRTALLVQAGKVKLL